jgi:uncharacterized membrane protein YebE (DUF533 family)
MADKSSNSGVYWVFGIAAIGIVGYFFYQNFYNQNIKDNPAISAYNGFLDTYNTVTGAFNQNNNNTNNGY